jgi:hypothetical protein
MTKKTSQELTSELFKLVQGIKLNDAAAIFGTTSNESILQELRKHVADLGSAINNKLPYSDVVAAYELAAGAVDTAAITGLIGEDERPSYYKIIEAIWAAIEHEKVPPNA